MNLVHEKYAKEINIPSNEQMVVFYASFSAFVNWHAFIYVSNTFTGCHEWEHINVSSYVVDIYSLAHEALTYSEVLTLNTQFSLTFYSSFESWRLPCPEQWT